ncbi:MAG: hypothetical protein PHC88_16780, partial [Terrimicrobiaceae bacterium]|nr:hypothetical protein [Terrimicrobiaceae bacterium]
MNILCAGINHHIAPVGLRERLAVANHEVADVLRRMRSIDGVTEAVVISTCNRVEFYAASICPGRALDGIRGYLEGR